MILPYLLRLVCLCLAAYFVVNFAAGLPLALASRAIVARANRMRARSAARLLFALRVLPAALALFVVVGLCVPSYLWLEPELAVEEIAAPWVAAAILGAALCLMTTARAARSLLRAWRHARFCRRLSRATSLAGARLPVWILDTQAPLCALVGIFRSGVLLSGAVVKRLTPAQLGLALRHEEAHDASRDNLKRLLILLIPGLLPGVSGFRAIERGWGRLIEWAADDEAAGGDTQRSLTLATALVRMARMGGAAVVPLSASFLDDYGDVSARVNRLLHPTPPTVQRHNWTLFGCLAAIFSLAVSLLHPTSLAACHATIERLIH